MFEAEAPAFRAKATSTDSRLAGGAAIAPRRDGAPRSRRGPFRAAIVTLRPRQWIKNVLVIAAAGAAGALGHDDVPVRVGLAFVAFCMLASGIYCINDVRDAEEDRRHPVKRRRPVAAGELDARVSVAMGIVLMVAGIVLCWEIRPLLAVVGGGYLVLTLSYTLVWRHLVVFDIVAIAGGFVLRAVAGGVASPVTLSKWFLLVVSAAAVFVAAGKRHAELMRNAAAAGRRRVLSGYTLRHLRAIMTGAAALAVFAYVVWAFQLPIGHGVLPWRQLTIIPFAACVTRYAMLIRRGRGESPEDLVLGDRPLQLGGVVWLGLFALAVHAAS